MNDRPAYRNLCKTAEKWRDLAEQRRDYFQDLYDSGRWQRYYSEDELLRCLRDVAALCDRWAAIVAQMRLNPLPKFTDKSDHRQAA